MSSGPQIVEYVSHSVNYTPFDCRWYPASAKLVSVGCSPAGGGIIQMFELDNGRLKQIQSQTYKSGIKCSTFAQSTFEARHLAVGDYDGGLHTYDMERLDTAVFSVPKAHSGIINAIDGVGGLNVGSGAAELVTGSRDGCVRIWDTRVNTPVASVEPADGEAPRDCWAVAFGNAYSDTERVVCSG